MLNRLPQGVKVGIGISWRGVGTLGHTVLILPSYPCFNSTCVSKLAVVNFHTGPCKLSLLE